MGRPYSNKFTNGTVALNIKTRIINWNNKPNDHYKTLNLYLMLLYAVLYSTAIFLSPFDVNSVFFFNVIFCAAHVAAISLSVNITASCRLEVAKLLLVREPCDNVKSISHDRVLSCSVDICGALNRQRLRSAIYLKLPVTLLTVKLEFAARSITGINVSLLMIGYTLSRHRGRGGGIISLQQAKLTSNNGLHARDANTKVLQAKYKKIVASASHLDSLLCYRATRPVHSNSKRTWQLTPIIS